MADSAPMIHLASATSTNDYLARKWNSPAGRPLAPFTAVLADYQTAGRGRLGRDWLAPKGKSLLMSVLVPMAPADLSWLPLMAGMAVQDALAPLIPGRVVLKWPNDVLIDGKKIAGVLSEYMGVRDGRAWVALGIGVNLTQTREELPDVPATSLLLEGGSQSPIALAAQIISALRTWLDAPIPQAEYVKRCVSARSAVNVTLPVGEVVSGMGLGVDEAGGLLIEVDGQVLTITAGDVALVEPSPSDVPELTSLGGTL